MRQIDELAALRAAIGEWRQAGERIAFVPTMGNLHAGHIALVEQAANHADHVVSSIFVNPLQFGPDEDLDRYPRTYQADCAKLAAAGCALVFAPTIETMYGSSGSITTTVSVGELATELCGASRPGHFDGVATVVARFFNLLQPDVALFGKKDYQQWRVLEQMTADLGFPIEIIGGETVRESDGLALSSRNGYLSADERGVAPELYATLNWAAEQLRYHHVDPKALAEAVNARLAEAGFRPDYCAIRRSKDLFEPATGDNDLVILAAAWLGRARLIDNLEVELTAG